MIICFLSGDTTSAYFSRTLCLHAFLSFFFFLFNIAYTYIAHGQLGFVWYSENWPIGRYSLWNVVLCFFFFSYKKIVGSGLYSVDRKMCFDFGADCSFGATDGRYNLVYVGFRSTGVVRVWLEKKPNSNQELVCTVRLSANSTAKSLHVNYSRTCTTYIKAKPWPREVSRVQEGDIFILLRIKIKE